MSDERKTGRFQHLEFEDKPLRIEQEAELTQQAQQPPGLLAEAAMDCHAYHHRGVQAFQRGEFEKALQFFTRTLELDRKYVPAWVGQVQMLIELNELREAGLWADKALELFRDQGDLLAAKGVTKARQKQRRESMGCSDASLGARGTTAYRWLARGEVLLACGEAQADACFERALLEPDADWFTRTWSARIYRYYAKRTSALVAARAATEQAPHAPFAWYVRGLCERDLAMATYRSSLQQALEIDGTFVLARAALREAANTSWLRRWYQRVRGD